MIRKIDFPSPDLKKPRYNRVKIDYLCLLFLCITYIIKVTITFFYFDSSHKFFHSMNHVTIY